MMFSFHVSGRSSRNGERAHVPVPRLLRLCLPFSAFLVGCAGPSQLQAYWAMQKAVNLKSCFSKKKKVNLESYIYNVALIENFFLSIRIDIGSKIEELIVSLTM